MARLATDVNIEELERRIRADGAAGGPIEDPLAELTRLIESFDVPEVQPNPVVDFAARRAAGVASRAPQVAPQWAAEPDAEEGVEETLRGTIDVEAPQPLHDVTPYSVEEEDLQAYADEPGQDDMVAVAAEPAPRAPRRWALRSAALLVIGLAGFGYYFYNKGVLPGLAKAPPTILAATTPAKVQPPSQDSVDAPDAAASLLRKGTTAVAAPAKIISSAEQPVDVKAELAVQPPPAPLATGALDMGPVPQISPPKTTLQASSGQGAAPSPMPSTVVFTPAPPPVASAPAVADAAPAPAPSPVLNPAPAPAVAALVAPPTATANPPAPAFPAPTKQHSVVIRPDGTLVADAAPSRGITLPAAAPTPALVNDKLPAAAQPSTPKLDISAKTPARLPTKLAPPLKTAAPDPSETTASLAAPDLKSKTAVAAAPAIDNGDTTTPAAVRPQGDAGTGRWSAQLAAPGSEAEANATLAKLQSQYGDALGGASLSVHKADVNGSTVYRIRAVGLEKSAAVDICTKVKSAGGGCFVAR